MIGENDSQDAHVNSSIVDDQLDSEPLITHCKIDGKANNVSFKTSNVSGWKETIFEHFGASLATSLKDGKVVNVLFEAKKAMNAIKINFYDTGSVVIQVQNAYYLQMHTFRYSRIN